MTFDESNVFPWLERFVLAAFVIFPFIPISYVNFLLVLNPVIKKIDRPEISRYY